MRGVPGIDVTKGFLEAKKKKLSAGGWPVSKWIQFCEAMLNDGYHLTVMEAWTTKSKYIYVTNSNRAPNRRLYKVRFSNHKPNPRTQEAMDSDFYVGVSHGQVTRTEDAIVAVRNFFKETT